MTRPARVIIDLAALRHNFSRIQTMAPGRKVMAIVKADAYGHGLVRVARTLEHADAFGVACIEEAQELRAAGVEQPIVLLEGPFNAQELSSVRELELDAVVHDLSQVQMLEETELQRICRVWLKVDSGMHRLGFLPEQLAGVWQRLQACDAVTKPLRLMSHLATANEPGNAMTHHQLKVFAGINDVYGVESSMANSAAVQAWPESHGDWVRPGLLLYGISAIDNTSSADYDLKPVMTLVSELISVKHIQKGEPVGYGASWACPEDMPIGIVATGYGDGFPRHAATGTPALVNGERASVIGNASMDMLTVDLRACPEAKVGDAVELWGENLSIQEIAKHADTLPYEILCGVHKRLRFVERH